MTVEIYALAVAAMAVMGFGAGFIVNMNSPQRVPRALAIVAGAIALSYLSVVTAVGAWAAWCPTCHSGSQTSEFARRDVLVLWVFALGIPVLTILASMGVGIRAAWLLRDRGKPPGAGGK